MWSNRPAWINDYVLRFFCIPMQKRWFNQTDNEGWWNECELIDQTCPNSLHSKQMMGKSFPAKHLRILATSLFRVVLMYYEWWLDMPSLTNVHLLKAFYYKNDVTISGSSRVFLVSWIDIGAFQNYFNWWVRGGLLFVWHIRNRKRSVAFHEMSRDFTNWSVPDATPLKSFHNVRLESSSIRQNLPSPFPWLWFR